MRQCLLGQARRGLCNDAGVRLRARMVEVRYRHRYWTAHFIPHFSSLPSAHRALVFFCSRQTLRRSCVC